MIPYLFGISGIICLAGIVSGTWNASQDILGVSPMRSRLLHALRLLLLFCVSSMAFTAAVDAWYPPPGTLAPSELFSPLWRVLSGLAIGIMYVRHIRRTASAPALFFQQEWPQVLGRSENKPVSVNRDLVFQDGSLGGFAGAVTGAVLVWNVSSENTLLHVAGSLGGFVIGAFFGGSLGGFTRSGFCVGVPGFGVAFSLVAGLHKLAGSAQAEGARIADIVVGPIFGTPHAIIASWSVGIALAEHVLIKKIAASFMRSVLIAFRFRTVLCPKCLRLAHPQASSYEAGQRFCEHCRRRIERDSTVKKLVVFFGDMAFPSDSTVLYLSNPDVEQRKYRLDLSEFHFVPAAVDPRRLERFLTFLLNYPPEIGYASVRVISHGRLDILGQNLKNALYNTFQYIEERPEEHR